MIRLGFVSAILPSFDLKRIFQTAQQLGYDSVELMCWPLGKAERRYAGVTHLDVTGNLSQTKDQLTEYQAAYNIRVSALGYYPNPLSPVQREAEIATAHIRKVIEAAAFLEIHLVNTFIGRDWTKSVDDNWPQFLTVWKPLIELAESRQVKIAIENCPMLFTADEWPGGKNLMTSPIIWERAFNDIKSEYLGLNFDPSHFIWQQMDYISAMEKFQNKLFHIHSKDAKLETAKLHQLGILAYPNQYHTPKLPGLGDVQWSKFMQKLHDIGYMGDVAVEVEDRSFEHDEQARINGLRVSQGYLSNVLHSIQSKR